MNELIEFRDSSIHGRGAFARTPLPAGERLIEYLGEKVTKAESLRRCEGNNEYIFCLDEEYDLDGNFEWNPARLINHSCEPNCEAQLEEGRIWIVSLRPIQSGEELTFNYGYDLESYQEHPCNCGSAKCVGFIVAEEFFPQLQKQREQPRPTPPGSL